MYLLFGVVYCSRQLMVFRHLTLLLFSLCGHKTFILIIIHYDIKLIHVKFTILAWISFIRILIPPLLFSKVHLLVNYPTAFTLDKIWYIKVHSYVIKWKHFPCYWPFVRGIHLSPLSSRHRGQWCRALIYSLIPVWANSWANNRDARDLRCLLAYYDIIVMLPWIICGDRFSRLKADWLLTSHGWETLNHLNHTIGEGS